MGRDRRSLSLLQHAQPQSGSAPLQLARLHTTHQRTHSDPANRALHYRPVLPSRPFQRYHSFQTILQLYLDRALAANTKANANTNVNVNASSVLVWTASSPHWWIDCLHEARSSQLLDRIVPPSTTWAWTRLNDLARVCPRRSCHSPPILGPSCYLPNQYLDLHRTRCLQRTTHRVVGLLYLP